MHTSFSPHQRRNLEYRCYLFWSLLGPILLLLIASSLPAVITVGGHFLKCIFDCNASKVFLFQSTALKRLKECQWEVQFQAAQQSCSSVATQYRVDTTFQLSGSEFWLQAKHEPEHTKGCLFLCWRNVPRNSDLENCQWWFNSFRDYNMIYLERDLICL